MTKEKFLEKMNKNGFDYAMFDLMDEYNFRGFWTKQEIIDCAKHYINERDDIRLGGYILAMVRNCLGVPYFYYNNAWDDFDKIVPISDEYDIPDYLFEGGTA